MSIDRKEISTKIENDEPFNIVFRFIDQKILMILNSTLAKMLAKLDHLFLLNSLVTIFREVIVNAQKANAKRVFFKANGLDINNPDNYREGIKRFKNEVIGDFEVLKKEIIDSKYYIDIYFERIGGDLFIKVSNNVIILPVELSRINLRIDKGIKYNDFSEAYEEIEDDTEGAGLGIVLTILFLKNMGIDPESFRIKSDGKVTETSLTIPKHLRPSAIISEVKKHLLNEIDGIPTFPENIMELMMLCNDPESSIEHISERIMLDPALSIDVIKLSNSAGFVPGKRIENVNTAVMTIGLKNLNAILVASNARRILDERYTSFEEIWEHCNKTAFYARTIGASKQVVENAFMAGLLHDLGKIILLSTDMKLVSRIAEEVKDRKIITSTIMEEITVGISHSTIGGLISESWNFPGYLIEAIKYHHSPLSASNDHKALVNTIYLANMLCGIEERKYSFYYLEESVLESFGILEEDKFTAFHEKLKKKYESVMK